MRAVGLIALTVAALVAGAAVPARAQIYRYLDEHGHAHYVQGLDRVPERYRARAVPLGLRSRPAPPAEEEPAAAAVGEPKGTVIRYTPGQPIMVDVRINGSTPARLLLDTGADRTLISPRALAAAGVSLTRIVAQGEMTGVTGTDRVQYVIVDSLEVGEAKVQRLPVAAYEMSTSPGDGLLGRDFLDQFNLRIDSERGEVTLLPK